MIMTAISASEKIHAYGSVVARVCVEELLDDAIDRHDLNLREQAHRALDLLDHQRSGHVLRARQQHEPNVAVELGRSMLGRKVRQSASNGADR